MTKPFLEVWDQAVANALETGEPTMLYRVEIETGETRLIGRTRHPAFMGGVPPKHDPNRDRRGGS